jgi:hypothetical protein
MKTNNRLLDQFFTNDDIVERCMKSIDDASDYDVVIEPSVGAGAFYHRICTDEEYAGAQKIAVDIDSSTFVPVSLRDVVIEQDYLTYCPVMNTTTTPGTDRVDSVPPRILVIGNPPFGKNASLAVKFFNHSAKFADTIAFIVPRTFRKPSLFNRLDPNFHMTHEDILPLDSFYVPSSSTPDKQKSYSVPCVWQIWKRGTQDDSLALRTKIELDTNHDHFEFVPKSDAEFLIQRVGAAAGRTHKDFSKSASSHYGILPCPGYESCYEQMQQIDWDKSSKYDTAGNPSISKSDIVSMYRARVEEESAADVSNS